MRVGPLFYWAWVKAEKAGFIPQHPHQGFEIITYVVSESRNMGFTWNKKCCGPRWNTGYANWIRSMAEEGFVGPNMEGFQIWFEPFLNEAIKRRPSYHQYHHENFPIEETNHYSIKPVIGVNSPVELVWDIEMWI